MHPNDKNKNSARSKHKIAPCEFKKSNLHQPPQKNNPMVIFLCSGIPKSDLADLAKITKLYLGELCKLAKWDLDKLCNPLKPFMQLTVTRLNYVFHLG